MEDEDNGGLSRKLTSARADLQSVRANTGKKLRFFNYSVSLCLRVYIFL